jgi:hypothetical protein
LHARHILQPSHHPLTKITCPNTIIHPGTMVIHSTDTSIANSTMMTEGRFESLTLSTHGVTGRISPLDLHGYGTFRNGTRIRKRRLGVTCECHYYKKRIYHAKYRRYTFRDRKCCHSNDGINEKDPYKSSHDGACLITGVHPDSSLPNATREIRNNIVYFL